MVTLRINKRTDLVTILTSQQGRSVFEAQQGRACL